MRYTYEQLLHLSKNPHYKLSQDQLEQLEAYQKQVVHDPTVKKHDPLVQKHYPKPKKEADGRNAG